MNLRDRTSVITSMIFFLSYRLEIVFDVIFLFDSQIYEKSMKHKHPGAIFYAEFMFIAWAVQKSTAICLIGLTDVLQ